MGEAKRLCPSLKKHYSMDGELESMLITYSFVINIDKSDSDDYHKGSLDLNDLGNGVLPIDVSLLIEISGSDSLRKSKLGASVVPLSLPLLPPYYKLYSGRSFCLTVLYLSAYHVLDAQ